MFILFAIIFFVQERRYRTGVVQAAHHRKPQWVQVAAIPPGFASC